MFYIFKLSKANETQISTIKHRHKRIYAFMGIKHFQELPGDPIFSNIVFSTCLLVTESRDWETSRKLHPRKLIRFSLLNI